MSLRQRLTNLGQRIDELSLRERLLLLGATVLVLFMAWDALLMAPLAKRAATVQAGMLAVQDRVERLNASLATAARHGGEDPNAELRSELDALAAEIAVLDEAIAAQGASLVAPRDMAPLLEMLLAKHGRLKLIGVRTLEREPLFRSEQDDSLTIWRHGLALELEGSYLDVLAYLREIEALPARFFWERVEIESREPPRNRVRLVIWSLNLEEGWLGV